MLVTNEYTQKWNIKISKVLVVYNTECYRKDNAIDVSSDMYTQYKKSNFLQTSKKIIFIHGYKLIVIKMVEIFSWSNIRRPFFPLRRDSHFLLQYQAKRTPS